MMKQWLCGYAINYSYYFAAKTLSCWSLLDAQRVFYKEKIIN